MFKEIETEWMTTISKAIVYINAMISYTIHVCVLFILYM